MKRIVMVSMVAVGLAAGSYGVEILDDFESYTPGPMPADYNVNSSYFSVESGVGTAGSQGVNVDTNAYRFHSACWDQGVELSEDTSAELSVDVQFSLTGELGASANSGFFGLSFRSDLTYTNVSVTGWTAEHYFTLNRRNDSTIGFFTSGLLGVPGAYGAGGWQANADLGLDAAGGASTSDWITVKAYLTDNGDDTFACTFKCFNGEAELGNLENTSVTNLTLDGWSSGEKIYPAITTGYPLGATSIGEASKVGFVHADNLKAEQVVPPIGEELFSFNWSAGGDDVPTWDNGAWGPLNYWQMWYQTTSPDWTSRFAQHRPGIGAGNIGGIGWRGQMVTNVTFSCEPGETLQVSMDYMMYLNGLESRPFMDMFFTDDGTVGAGGTADHPFGHYDNELGFRLFQIDNSTTDGTVQFGFDPTGDAEWNVQHFPIEATAVGLAPSTSDLKGDMLKLVYTATKTLDSGVWSCNVTVSNIATELTYTMAENLLVTNADAYAASDLYLAFYAPANWSDGVYDGSKTGGYEMDNLLVKRLPAPPPVGWEAFIEDYGLTGVKTDHGDADGLNDWGEYVLGGDPTNSSYKGQLPVFDGATGDYLYWLIGDTNVVATVMTRDGMEAWHSWATNGVSVYVTNANGEINSYTNHIGTDDGIKFMKLMIE